TPPRGTRPSMRSWPRWAASPARTKREPRLHRSPPGIRSGASPSCARSAAAGWASCTRPRTVRSGAPWRSRCSPPPPRRRAAAAVSHPGIATIYEIGEVSGRSYIAMELVRGVTLRDRLARGDVEVDEAITIARDVARALAHAHARGFVHRDLKPENVMITED